METMLKIVGLVFLVAVVLGLHLVLAYVDVSSDYTRKIEVDDSSKVEWAISNAVDDVRSRGFVVKTLSVKYCWIGKMFMVSCGGIERGNLLRK